MPRFATVWSLLIAAVYGATDCGFADTQPSAPNLTAKTAAAGRFAEWIQQLDSDRFADRNEASRRLDEAGKDAVPALVEAALGTSREATLRAIEILRKHSQEGDETSKKAAREALQKIAASDHAAAARRAKDVLDPPKPVETAPPPVPIVQGWPIGGQQVQVQIQLNAGAGNQQRRIQITNGVKQIEATENDLKVKITEDAAGGVQMEVTRRKDGKETTEKYSAKSRDELKKNQPEAYRLYDKYAQQQNARIQIQAVPGWRPAERAIPAPPNPK
jgi:hypothetical protein